MSAEDTGRTTEGAGDGQPVAEASTRSGGLLADDHTPAAVTATETAFEGMVWDVVRETFDLPEAEHLTRDFVDHSGAVAIAAVDTAGRVLLINQYRHPVRARIWELPAGLLDKAEEPPHEAAARELAEEADLEAATWHVLADIYSSPGGTSETLRIYLARDLSPVPDADRHEREGEESGIVTRWVPLAEAVAAAAGGRIGNATTIIGLLMAARALDAGGELRPVDAPWPARRIPGRMTTDTSP